jgi:hypothetical protein
LHAIAIQVGQKYYPAQVPEDISAMTLNSPQERAVGMRLTQLVKAWAEGYRSESVRQVLMDGTPPPEGFELVTYSKRAIEDPVKFERAASKFLTPDEYQQTLSPTLGATEKAIRNKAPRGQKDDAINDFKAHLEDEEAVTHTNPVPYLGAVSRKRSKPNGEDR